MSTRSPNGPRSVVDTLTDLGRDVPELFRGEIRLFKAEMAESGTRLTQAAIGVVSGLLIATVALLVLVQALVLGLAEHMPGWLASVVVGVLLAAIALVLVLRGKRDLRPEALLPTRTMDAVKKDKRMVEEKVT